MFLAQRLVQLRLQGFTVLPVSAATNSALTIAAKAFQGQLEVCGQQPSESRYAGYQWFSQKHRLQFRTGDSDLENVGILQHLAVKVHKSTAASGRSPADPY